MKFKEYNSLLLAGLDPGNVATVDQRARQDDRGHEADGAHQEGDPEAAPQPRQTGRVPGGGWGRTATVSPTQASSWPSLQYSAR